MNAPFRLPRTRPDDPVAFLQALDPKGAHNLVDIGPDTGAVTGICVPSGELSRGALLIAEAANSRANHYYTPNEPSADAPDGKLKKHHIARIRAVWIDKDPDKNKPFEEERKRLLALAEEWRNHPLYPPSFAIDSGNGVQLLWKLTDNPSHANAEALGRGLQKLFKADACWNVDRLLRLPGTINYPDARKKALGRKEAPAVLLYATGDTYTFDDLCGLAQPIAEREKPVLEAVGVDKAQLLEPPSDELLARFGRAREADVSIERLWNGDRTAAPGTDDSGSGFAFALAGKLKRTGQFTATEFGQLAREWEHASDPERIDARYVARAWGNNEAVSAEEEFGAVGNCSEIEAADENPLGIERIEPFFARDDVPPRRWVMDRLIVREHLSVLIAPSSAGKSTFTIAAALAVVTGRSDIVGLPVRERVPAFLWNAEDPKDEMRRRIEAVMQAFDVKWDDLKIDGELGLHFGSGVGKRLKVAVRRGNGMIIPGPDAKHLQTYLAKHRVGLAIFDPLIALHEANENDNPEMEAVGNAFREIAHATSCGIVVAHHTRKPPQSENTSSFAGDMNMGRGAIALETVARVSASLYEFDKAFAKKFGIPENEAHQYVRLDDAKNNLGAKSGAPLIYRREGIDISNGDQVGILRPTPLRRAADSEIAKRNMLTTDVIGVLAQSDWMSFTDLAKALLALPMYSETNSKALTQRIAAVFAGEVEQEGARYCTEQRSIPGRKGRHNGVLRKLCA